MTADDRKDLQELREVIGFEARSRWLALGVVVGFMLGWFFGGLA